MFSQPVPFQLSILPRISSSTRPDSFKDFGAIYKAFTYLLSRFAYTKLVMVLDAMLKMGVFPLNLK